MRSDLQLRVTHLRRVKLQELDAPQRHALETKLADIFLASFVGPTPREVIETYIYRGPELGVALLLNSEQEVLGFVSVCISRCRVGAREFGLLDGGVYCFPGVRGGGALGIRMCFRHALGHMLRYPRLAIVNVGLALHPLSYRRLRENFPGFYPRLGAEPTAEIEAMVREIAARRHFVAVADDPWVVRRRGLDVRLRAPERLVTVMDDADSRYYIERNPGYAQGDALLTYYILNARNLLSSVARSVLRAVRSNRLVL